MDELFSDRWLHDLEAAAREAGIVATDESLVIQQVITEPAGSETAYVIEVGADGVRAHQGRAEVADVVFTLDREAAEAVHRGELSAQVAFMEGRLRVGGDLRRLTSGARAAAAVASSFPGSRSR